MACVTFGNKEQVLEAAAPRLPRSYTCLQFTFDHICCQQSVISVVESLYVLFFIFILYTEA